MSCSGLRGRPWIWLAAILLVVGVVRARLASMPLERDEGEYAYMAQLMLEGTPPFAAAFAMKFPGIYAAYAVILPIFGQTDVGIRWALIFLNGATILAVYWVARKLAGSSTAADSVAPGQFQASGITAEKAGLCSAAIYAVMSLAPSMLGITANAEHFVLLPALLGASCMLGFCGPERWFLGGVCLGLAVTMKQQGVVFAALGAAGVVLSVVPAGGAAGGFLRRVRLAARPLALYIAGVGIPVLAMILWVWGAGVFEAFWFWCVEYARFYGNMWGWAAALKHFSRSFGPIFSDHLPLFAAAAFGMALLWRQKRTAFWWIAGWLVAGCVAVSPGRVFRPHYFLFLLPGIALAGGFGLAALPRWKIFAVAALLFPLVMQREALLLQPPEETCRLLYRNSAFKEARDVARELRDLTKKEERIGILGSEPEIFFYAQRHSATPYIYMYPLLEPQPFALAMQRHMIHTLEDAPPRYLVHVRVPTSWVPYPDSDMTVINWLLEFLKQRYEKMKSFRAPERDDSTDERELVLYRRKS